MTARFRLLNETVASLSPWRTLRKQRGAICDAPDPGISRSPMTSTGDPLTRPRRPQPPPEWTIFCRRISDGTDVPVTVTLIKEGDRLRFALKVDDDGAVVLEDVEYYRLLANLREAGVRRGEIERAWRERGLRP